jgi:hypothetical protein
VPVNSFFGHFGAVRRLTSLRAISLPLVFSFAAFSASAQIYHDPHRKTTIGFSVDLNTPPDTVLQIVKGVAADSIIRGTAATVIQTARYYRTPLGTSSIPPHNRRK